MKKVFGIIKTIIVWMVVILAVFMMVFTVVSVNTFNRNDREILGYKAYIVLSDSMSASGIDAGDLILVKQADPRTLEPGDIIAYTSQNTESYGQTITHMIRYETTDINGEPGFVTYGTTTGVDDTQVVTYPFIQGKYEACLPQVGTFFNFMRTTQGYIVCILIPFLLLIMYQGLNCIRNFRYYKEQEMLELKAKEDEIAAQRAESQAMMAQLLAMRDQIAAQTQQTAAPAPKEQPDVAAMMAELEALRAQVAKNSERNEVHE